MIALAFQVLRKKKKTMNNFEKWRCFMVLPFLTVVYCRTDVGCVVFCTVNCCCACEFCEALFVHIDWVTKWPWFCCGWLRRTILVDGVVMIPLDTGCWMNVPFCVDVWRMNWVGFPVLIDGVNSNVAWKLMIIEKNVRWEIFYVRLKVKLEVCLYWQTVLKMSLEKTKDRETSSQ